MPRHPIADDVQHGQLAACYGREVNIPRQSRGLGHGFWKAGELSGAWLRAGGRIGQQRCWPTEAELVGIVLSVELHQKCKNPVRKLPRQFIVRSKLFADRGLKGSETQICIPCVVFAAFREIEPLLRHFEK